MSSLTPFESRFPTKPAKFIAPLVGEKVDTVPSDGRYIGLEQLESWTGQLSGVELAQKPEGAANVFRNGDVLFGKLRPYLAKCWVADGSGYCTTEGLVLRPVDADARFVRYALLTHEAISAIDGSTYGSKMPRADWSFIGAVQLPAPGREEQERIANYLDDRTARIDALIAEKVRLSEVLQESLESCIERAVLAPALDTKTCRLKYVVHSISTGPFGSALHASEYVEGGTPVINPAHIVQGVAVPNSAVSVDAATATRLSSYAFSVGDLVVGRRGEMGRCAVIQADGAGWLCGTGSLVVRPDPRRVLADYLQLVISSKASRDWLSLESVGSTMENLNEQILLRLPGYFPSLVEQEQRLKELRQAKVHHDALGSHVNEHIARLREYRSSLISAAVTGQLSINENRENK